MLTVSAAGSYNTSCGRNAGSAMQYPSVPKTTHCAGRLRLKCDDTRPETRFRLSTNGRVHLNWWGRQFSRLLAAEVCASAVVMLDTPCFEVVWRVLATHSIRQFPLHFPSRASPCAITFQLDSTIDDSNKESVLLLCQEQSVSIQRRHLFRKSASSQHVYWVKS
jgi:hypothetical protein